MPNFTVKVKVQIGYGNMGTILYNIRLEIHRRNDSHSRMQVQPSQILRICLSDFQDTCILCDNSILLSWHSADMIEKLCRCQKVRHPFCLNSFYTPWWRLLMEIMKTSWNSLLFIDMFFTCNLFLHFIFQMFENQNFKIDSRDSILIFNLLILACWSSG